jgi:hypothetical protein
MNILGMAGGGGAQARSTRPPDIKLIKKCLTAEK